MFKKSQISKMQENIDGLQRELDAMKKQDCCKEQSSESILREYFPGLKVIRYKQGANTNINIKIKHKLTNNFSPDKKNLFLEIWVERDEKKLWDHFFERCIEWKTQLIKGEGLILDYWGDRGASSRFSVYLEHFLVHCDTPKIPVLIEPNCGCKK